MNRSQVKVDTDLSLGHGLPHYVLCMDLWGVAGSSVGKRPHHRPAIRSRGEAQSVHLKGTLSCAVWPLPSLSPVPLPPVPHSSGFLGLWKVLGQDDGAVTQVWGQAALPSDPSGSGPALCLPVGILVLGGL